MPSLDYQANKPAPDNAHSKFIARKRPWWRRHVRRIVLSLLAAALILVGVLDRVAGNRVIQFYGQVVDESGRGMPGVNVSAEISFASPFGPFRNPWTTTNQRSPVATVTDAEGRFSFYSWRGLLLSIEKIESPGALWKWKDDSGHGFERSFSYTDRYQSSPPPTDPARPVRFTMIPATDENKREMGRAGPVVRKSK